MNDGKSVFAFLRCRLGLHRWPTEWPKEIRPFLEGGPYFVLEQCDRCDRQRFTRNF